jgi:glycosyltransferase involved in cell wall biosynthesis
LGGSENKHIILVSYYWPPAGGSGVQRWWFFANHLAKRGWNIDVVTVQDPVGSPVDDSLQDQTHPNIQVFPLSIWEPGKRLYHFGKPKAKGGIVYRIIRWVRANFFFPDARQFFVKPAIRLIKKRLIQQPAHWLITTGPPHSMHLVGYDLRKTNDIQWLTDFRDPWSQFFVNYELPMMSSVRNRHRRMEEKVVSAADCVITTSPSLTAIYKQYNPSVLTILNGYEKVLDGQFSQKFTMTYAGALKSNHHLELVFSALKTLSARDQLFVKEFRFRFYGASDNINPPTQLKDQFVSYGYRSKQEIDFALPQSHILLLLGNDHPDSQLVIHGKLYAYMAARRPVLALVNKHGDMSKLIREYKLGAVFLYTETDEITDWIASQFQDYKAGTIAHLAIPDQNFSREKQAEDLHLLLNKLQS